MQREKSPVLLHRKRRWQIRLGAVKVSRRNAIFLGSFGRPPDRITILKSDSSPKSFHWLLQFLSHCAERRGIEKRSFVIEDYLVVSNLVDPASSHMLVLKIKPCMSKYKLLYGETANGSLKQL